MLTATRSLQLPSYPMFIEAISSLALPLSPSELHGVMCGYLCAGATSEGESYLRALIANIDDTARRAATLALFGVYAVSQQQIINFNFEFQFLLPDENDLLINRAQAFSEWCAGFTHGISQAGISSAQLAEEEAIEAMQHLQEFAQLDYESLDMNEDDERALTEVSEYARLAVLHIYSDLEASKSHGADESLAH